MYTALTIAGSDPSGGAGIQADIKTMTAHGVYAMSALTALTAQNTTGVYDIMEVTAPFLAKQLDCIFTDIFPDAVKTGMTASAELIGVIADKLKEHRAVHIVVDPVMVSTSGSRLIDEDAIDALREKLLPLAELITPNIPEAEVLSGRHIATPEDMEQAAKWMQEHFGCNVLVKGGHQTNTANDVLCVNNRLLWFPGQHIDNPNTHGTGCTLSSAIASNLAMGQNLGQAVQNAKDYLSGALLDMLDLGAGSGPLNHMYRLKG
ncbi:MAG: bifunctional hydroxymethylpyrimidine kinase/phosphomethylpyrimidine kinase [Lachnospiraceae bacterium]|nr:bifunctional hydroxymethylpyrimidine kinase/phosphomethylpyrimidine kinase [Lachnospiraceae bacterium]